tara:strand:- start:406 stop:942 length:537 start_codon:yes stop_codon:yes gene_type:complete
MAQDPRRNNRMTLKAETLAKIDKKMKQAAKRRNALDIPVDMIIHELWDNNCDVDKTATSLDVTLYSLIKVTERNKQIREMMSFKRTTLVNKAEQNLERDLNLGDQKATFFTLKTLGKEKGYYEKEDPSQLKHDPATVNAKINLANLSGSQLTDLSNLLKDAENGQPIIDVTPVVTEKT